MILAHVGVAPQPHDLWSAWNLDPVVLVSLFVTAWTYGQGMTGQRHPPPAWRRWSFAGGLGAISIAMISPLDAMAQSLASAHMVQHVLLIMVAAPLLVLARPLTVMLRGLPWSVRERAARVRGFVGLTTARTRRVWHPAGVWLAYVGSLWLWHSRVLYDAALSNDLVHILEHGTFFVTGLMFWGLVAGARGARPLERGHALLVVFAATMQSVLLSALLTFAGTPWYDGYATTTQAWGLSHLADQQLAGVIMWVPTGLVYLAAILTLLVTWLWQTDDRLLKRPGGSYAATSGEEIYRRWPSV